MSSYTGSHLEREQWKDSSVYLLVEMLWLEILTDLTRIIALQNFVVFLSNLNMNQPQVYIYPLPFEPPSYLPPHPTPLGWYRAPVSISWDIQQIYFTRMSLFKCGEPAVEIVSDLTRHNWMIVLFGFEQYM